MVLFINSRQLSRLNTFSSVDDYIDGWRYLASIGDTYADNAFVGASIYSLAPR